MTNRLFYKYPSRKNPLGNRQTVSTATPDMMRLIQSRYYVPNNSALIVTGDVQPDEIYKMAQDLFGSSDRCFSFCGIRDNRGHPVSAAIHGHEAQCRHRRCHSQRSRRVNWIRALQVLYG